MQDNPYPFALTFNGQIIEKKEKNDPLLSISNKILIYIQISTGDSSNKCNYCST